jgi:hypothetical protein
MFGLFVVAVSKKTPPRGFHPRTRSFNPPVHFPEMLPWAETTEASAKARITGLENMAGDSQAKL